MELLATSAPLALTVSLALLTVLIGLDATPDELLSVIRRPWVTARAVVAVNIVVPAVAILCVFLIPISPAAKAGVLVMAIASAPPMTAFRQMHVGAGRAYAYGHYLVLLLAALVFVPASLQLLRDDRWIGTTLPAAVVVVYLLFSALLPLGLGVAMRRWAPRSQPKLEEWIGNAAVLLIIGAFFPFPLLLLPIVHELIGDGTLLVMALVTSAGLAAGHLLGGPDPAARRALAVTAANRHPGIALLIASANGAESAEFAAILSFFLVGALTTAVYERWSRRAVATHTGGVGEV